VADDGWVRIPPPTTHQRLYLAATVASGVMAVSGYGLFHGAPDLAAGWLGDSAFVRILALVVAFAVLLGVCYVVVGVRTQPPAVHPGRGMFRIGKDEVPFSDLTGAKPEAGDDRKPSLRVLRLLTRGGDSCSVVVATAKGMALTPEQSGALVQAVRGSAIAPPRNPDDPTGRFAHINFPGDLDIPRTIAYIESPPPAPPGRRRHGSGSGSGSEG
jgi:hypothetical protein